MFGWFDYFRFPFSVKLTGSAVKKGMACTHKKQMSAASKLGTTNQKSIIYIIYGCIKNVGIYNSYISAQSKKNHNNVYDEKKHRL